MKSFAVKLCVITAFASSIFVGGCSKSTDTNKVNEVPAKSDNRSSTLGAGSALPPIPEAPVKSSSADTARPLDQFVLLDTGDAERHFLMIYYALHGDAANDERVLGTLSASYNNERDVFKKKEIAAQEAPRIQTAFEQHKRMRYVAFVLNPGSLISLDNYDFAKKGFSINSNGTRYANGDRRGCLLDDRAGSGVSLEFLNGGSHCFAAIEDIELAKNIEAVRAGHKGKTQFIAYAYVEEASNGSLKLTVIAVRAQVMDSFNKNANIIADIRF